MDSSRIERVTPPPAPAHQGNLLLRLHWMFVGAAALSICIVVLARDAHPVLSAASLAVWVVAASMAAARWIDVARFGGRTADGLPATMQHVRRYTLRLGLITGAAWTGAVMLG